MEHFTNDSLGDDLCPCAADTQNDLAYIKVSGQST
jgi:hypothetical protein